MADVMWTTTKQALTGTGDTLIRTAADFIMSHLGASLDEEIIDGTTLYLYYELSDGMGFCASGATTIDNPGLTVCVAYKSSNGDWKRGGQLSSSNSSNRVLYEGDMACNRAEIGGCDVYEFVTPFPAGNKGNVNFVATIVRATDYFSQETRDVIWSGYSQSEGLSRAYTWDENSSSIENVSFVPMGPNAYPSGRGLHVATPVMIQTTTFYGYIEKTTFLYRIWPSTHVLGEQFELNGRTFEALGSVYAVRIG